MNIKLWGAFALALVVVLGLPLLGGIFRSGGTAASASAQAFTPPASAGKVVASTAAAAPVAAAAVADAVPEIPSIVDAPPMLDETSLIGTAWQVSHTMGTIEVNLMGNGVAQAHHMLLGNLQGTWMMEGSNIVVTASLGSKTETIRVQVRGTDLYYQGVAIQRIR